jgi:hypothetical protein
MNPQNYRTPVTKRLKLNFFRRLACGGQFREEAKAPLRAVPTGASGSASSRNPLLSALRYTFAVGCVCSVAPVQLAFFPCLSVWMSQRCCDAAPGSAFRVVRAGK